MYYHLCFFRRTEVKPSCEGQLLKWKARYDISLHDIFTKPFKIGILLCCHILKYNEFL